MRIGVITFPGSLDDHDAAHAITACGGEAVALWHADTSVGNVDAVVLPGGFSYGDYLRCGAVAHRAAIMDALQEYAADGGPVLGICNGFQILCEAGLLPGALLRNAGLRFVCRAVALTVTADTAWTRDWFTASGEDGDGREDGADADGGPTLTVPIKNGEGRYYADAATLDRVEADGQVVFRYAPGDNPNGSERDIAGVSNLAGNVVGMMPHPEHAVDADLVGGTGGRGIFTSVLSHLAGARVPV